jgi:hypothetical protein
MMDWKTMELGEVLSSSELKEVKKFLVANDEKGLREFLNEKSRKDRLSRKGVLSDFLYYVLIYRKDEIKKLKQVGL